MSDSEKPSAVQTTRWHVGYAAGEFSAALVFFVVAASAAVLAVYGAIVALTMLLQWAMS